MRGCTTRGGCVDQIDWFVDEFCRLVTLHANYDLGLKRHWTEDERFFDDARRKLKDSAAWGRHLSVNRTGNVGERMT